MDKKILDNPAFRNIGRERLELIAGLSEKIKGKSALEALDILQQSAAAISSGKRLTQKEQQAIFLALASAMSPNELKNMEYILSLMEAFGK